MASIKQVAFIILVACCIMYGCSSDHSEQNGDYDTADGDNIEDSDNNEDDSADADMDNDLSSETDLADAEEDGDVEEDVIESETENDTDENLCDPPCTDPNSVCDSESGQCICPDNYCKIGQSCIADNSADSENLCLYCDFQKDRNDWSVRPANFECRAAAGLCDIAEVCDGTNGGCPTDVLEEVGTGCRASSGVCDTEEVCDGTNAECPSDEGVENGTACNDGNDCTANDICTNKICSGALYNCNDNGECNIDDDICTCDSGFAGDYCDRCPEGQLGYPDCQKIINVSGGFQHSCAVLESGAVKCWGENNKGQLGDNSTTNRLVPTQVYGLESGAVSVSAGAYHSCAIMESGAAKCWGNNDEGQLGDGTTMNALVPVQVSGLESGVVEISAGYSHTCALLNTGAMMCWGINGFGQLGISEVGGSRHVPTQVTWFDKGIVSIATGWYHSCAVQDLGDTKACTCFGNNTFGQIGDNTVNDRFAPTQVYGLSSGVAKVTAGDHNTCALLESGGMMCWGYGPNLNNDLIPVQVAGLESGVIAMSIDGGHTCAILEGNILKCWGDNRYGQLGDDSLEDKQSPTQVTGFESNVASIELGFWHTCGTLDDGSLYCWGKNERGQLGDNTTGNKNTPTPPVER